jgi:spore maturation protein CgeB
MKVLFIAVFDNEGISSNTSQAIGLMKLGINVLAYDYRKRLNDLGSREKRDIELIQHIHQYKPDLTIFAKCNGVSNYCVEYASQISKVCYWFPDPLSTYNSSVEYLEKTMLSDFLCCDKENVKNEGLKYNKKSFVVEDGYDPELEKPRKIAKDISLSFIGSLYGYRSEFISKINEPVTVFSNCFGENHSKVVSRTKINLNFCTANSASDRIYKIMAAGGFLLTNDWEGRESNFTDGKDLVIFDTITDLNKKIKYYLDPANEKERELIAKNGMKKNKNFSRYEWASKLVSLFSNLK